MKDVEYSCRTCGNSSKSDGFKQVANSWDMMSNDLHCPNCPLGGCVDEASNNEQGEQG